MFKFVSEVESSLKKFLDESVSMSPEERAKYLETYEVSVAFKLLLLILGNKVFFTVRPVVIIWGYGMQGQLTKHMCFFFQGS